MNVEQLVPHKLKLFGVDPHCVSASKLIAQYCMYHMYPHSHMTLLHAACKKKGAIHIMHAAFECHKEPVCAASLPSVNTSHIIEHSLSLHSRPPDPPSSAHAVHSLHRGLESSKLVLLVAFRCKSIKKK